MIEIDMHRAQHLVAAAETHGAELGLAHADRIAEGLVACANHMARTRSPGRAAGIAAAFAADPYFRADLVRSVTECMLSHYGDDTPVITIRDDDPGTPADAPDILRTTILVIAHAVVSTAVRTIAEQPPIAHAIASAGPSIDPAMTHAMHAAMIRHLAQLEAGRTLANDVVSAIAKHPGTTRRPSPNHHSEPSESPSESRSES